MTKYYTFPSSDIGLEKILEYFNFLVKEYGYKIISKKKHKYYVNIIYKNTTINRIIEITNGTNYTDYGFSIFMRNTENGKYNMVVNQPYEKQDKECTFIKNASEFVSLNYSKLVDEQNIKSPILKNRHKKGNENG
jgi:hypothetical protein